MAGTLPHAVFVETDVDESGTAVAFAGELPGCAAAADDATQAVAGVPARVTAFVAWLHGHGEPIPEPVGNWYEVERVAADRRDGVVRRATFSLDELPPSAAELATWTRWAELAREDVAEALDAVPDAATETAWVADQDVALLAELGGTTAVPPDLPPLDRLYAARDALMEAVAGAGTDGSVRRALRLAIVDDLRLAERIRGR
jgi:predicted RNase H-like HicB family nuclease